MCWDICESVDLVMVGGCVGESVGMCVMRL